MGADEGDRGLRRRARELLDAGRGQEALALANQALRAAPHDAGWLVVAARARAAAGDAIGAESMLLKAVRSAPEDVDALVRLGELLSGRDPARAVKVLERAAKLSPGDTSIAAQLERARASVGRPRPSRASANARPSSEPAGPPKSATPAPPLASSGVRSAAPPSKEHATPTQSTTLPPRAAAESASASPAARDAAVAAEEAAMADRPLTERDPGRAARTSDALAPQLPESLHAAAAAESSAISQYASAETSIAAHERERQSADEPAVSVEPSPTVAEPGTVDEPAVSVETSPAAAEPETVVEPSVSAETSPAVAEPESVVEPSVSAETSRVAEPESSDASTISAEPESVVEPSVSAETSPGVAEPEPEPVVEPSVSAETSRVAESESVGEASVSAETSPGSVEPERSVDEREVSAETSTSDPSLEGHAVAAISEVTRGLAEGLLGGSIVDVPESVAETAADEVEPSLAGRAAMIDERDAVALPAGVVDGSAKPSLAAESFEVVDGPTESVAARLEEHESPITPADPSAAPTSVSEEVDVVAIAAPKEESRPGDGPPLLSPFVAIHTPVPPRGTKNTLLGVPAAPNVPRPAPVPPPAPVIAEVAAPDRARHERALPSRLRDGPPAGPPLAPPASGRGTEQSARTPVLSGPGPVRSDARSADAVASPTTPVLPTPSAPRDESPGTSEEEREPPKLAAPSEPAIGGEAEPVAIAPVPPPPDGPRAVSGPAVDEAPVAIAPFPPPPDGPSAVSGSAVDEAPVAVAPVPPLSDGPRAVSGSAVDEAPVAVAPVPPPPDAPEVVIEPAIEASVAVAPMVSTSGVEPVAAPAREEAPPVPVLKVEPAFQPAAKEPQPVEGDPQRTLHAPPAETDGPPFEAEPRRGCRAIVLAAFGLVVLAGVAVGGYAWSTSEVAPPTAQAASAPAPQGATERDPNGLASDRASSSSRARAQAPIPADTSDSLAGHAPSPVEPSAVVAESPAPTHGDVGTGGAPSPAEASAVVLRVASTAPNASAPTPGSTFDGAEGPSASAPTPGSTVDGAMNPSASASTPGQGRASSASRTVASAGRATPAESALPASDPPEESSPAIDSAGVQPASGGDVEASLTRVAGLVRARHPERALRTLEHVERAGVPAHLRMRASYLRGRAELMADRYADATRTLERVVAAPEAPARAFFFLGEAASRHNTPVASAAYQRYLELEPEGRFAARARRALTPSDRSSR